MTRRIAVKLCMVGEAAVGKTRLVKRFVIGGEGDDTYEQTLGSRVYKRRYAYAPSGREGADVELSVWDIMGQKGFRELLKDAYFYGAHGALAVCDVTRRGTLDDLRGWIGGLREIAGPVPMVLVANKTDLADAAEVREKDVALLAEAYDAPYFLTSAKTGEKVEEAFLHVIGKVAEGRLAMRGGAAPG